MRIEPLGLRTVYDEHFRGIEPPADEPPADEPPADERPAAQRARP
jgi:hypothetical protein